MEIAITGHTGFLGNEMKNYFSLKGHTITGIGRKDFKEGAEHLSSILNKKDILINLAGAPIIGRWTKKYSKELWDSRILTVQTLVKAIKLTASKPKLFLSASAIGIYSGNGIHTEESTDFDKDFLGILCQRWEEEALEAKDLIKTYILRTGIVLGKSGGALPKMSLPFKLGVGGKIGSGKQITSWIHISDYVESIDYIIRNQPYTTVYNLTAPVPVSNATLSAQIARTLKRPNLFTVPSAALRLLYGEGSVALLSGQNVIPESLIKAGYVFKFSEIEKALEDLLR